MIHRLTTSFVLGYHGCDRGVAEQLVAGGKFKPSRNSYDWLGHGIYFWESNPDRALSFVKNVRKRQGKSDRDVAVVGAPIDLGYCLDLLSERSIEIVRDAYWGLKALFDSASESLPVNAGGDDLLRRNLDCAVVNYLHEAREEAKQLRFQTVRGVFIEGKPLFENSGFREKTHIQICVRAAENIKGVFKVT